MFYSTISSIIIIKLLNITVLNGVKGIYKDTAIEQILLEILRYHT